jgi:hypothetical protein
MLAHLRLSMIAKQAKQRWFHRTDWRKLSLRVIGIVCCALAAGWVLQLAVAAAERQEGEAGFAQGTLHGALMPCALPHLLVGRDVRIFAENNTGRTYKLGYTVGVNGCGAIFFGLFFWRVNRWRKSLARVADRNEFMIESELSAGKPSTEGTANAS